MRPDPDGVGEVSHELRPVRRVLFPAVMQEQVQPGAHAQDRETALGLFRHKAHQQNVLYARHGGSSVEHAEDLDVTQV